MIEPIESNDELHWLAFRYVAGEMTDREENSFENRLADDQEAREAVEQTLELQQAVALVSAEAQFAARSVRRLNRHPVAWAGTAAACLLAAFWLSWLVRPNAPLTKSNSTAHQPDRAVTANHPQDSPSLASAWTDIRRARNTEDSGFGLTERIETPLTAQSEAGMSESGQPGAIPGWLLTAVSTETEQNMRQP